MPRQGNGNYVLPQPPFVATTVIQSAAVNSDLSDIAAALTGSVAADGQTPMTGNLAMAGNSITGANAVSSTSLTTTTIVAATATLSGKITASNIGSGCTVIRTTNQNIPVASPTIVNFESELYDDAAIWNAGSPSRLTVPAGYTRVRMSFGLLWSWSTTYDWVVFMYKNGSAFNGSPPAFSFTRPSDSAISAIVPVVGGDFFQLEVSHTGAGTQQILSNTGTWFSMEILR